MYKYRNTVTGETLSTPFEIHGAKWEPIVSNPDTTPDPAPDNTPEPTKKPARAKK